MTDTTRTRPDWPEGTHASVEAGNDLAPAQYVGRYRIERALGKGSFGVVYLARDEQLNRFVSIKVPYRTLIPCAEDAEAHLAEARTLAHLDHPNIVPVYDVGSTEHCPCFIVSKYIEGQTLSEQMKFALPSLLEATRLVATLAEALHFAHGHGIVHRDIKPSNILIDRHGKPYLTDFGLALKEERFGEGPRFAGTAAYMSPEQARGEGHRVDGRSDVFSLGVIFYELLTGRRPFKGDSRDQLREQIVEVEPRPPRQFMDSLPRELERICLKALAKRASERYLTARDFAEDLRHFLAEAANIPYPYPCGPSALAATVVMGQPVRLPENAALAGTVPASAAPSSTVLSEPVLIVPKGLRSFDAHDADFFLELVPGPRDRTGLPDSIRFWKTFIEERDADNTSPVGLLYGPSGCGKSSLVKAGLLPRLSEDVLAVYIEATADDTETRLLNNLRKRLPSLIGLPGLTETLAAVRRGQGIPPGNKLLIVLDQFEQWLHAKRGQQGTELVQALRQCDGGRVQCLVLVRDDFWMAATRFMRELEIPLLEGQNSAAIDLFDSEHAMKVLAAFGRAFGRFTSETPTREQKEFLRQAVAELTQDDKIICVRLALFAEMMKGKPWTPASLRAVGGTEGVGATFLEETFSAATAPPHHRLHQQAARTVLKSLLPESGTSIKGNMRSREELLEASGYADRLGDFEALLRILDSEVRLITPTDPEGEGIAPEIGSRAATPGKYYQLTHDYLVHSLRNWLTRKQKETRRGRAELLLADLTSAWNARPENRQLPSLTEWLRIRVLSCPKQWSEPERRMMHQAVRYHTVRGIALALLLAVVVVIVLLIRDRVVEHYQARDAENLVERLLVADTSQVPGIVADLEPYRRWADPQLREENARASHDPRRKLHSSLALLPVDPGQVPFLRDQLLEAGPQLVPVLRDALAEHHKDELTVALWQTAEHPPKGKESQRLRAACALAAFDPHSPRWAKIRDQVADDLVAVPAVQLTLWLELLRDVSPSLIDPLARIYRDSQRHETARSLATDILVVYAGNQPEILVDLLLDANDQQFAPLYAKLQEHGENAVASLQKELNRPLPAAIEQAAKEKFDKRRANAAVALLRLGKPMLVWPLLRHSSDPSVRSYLIDRLGPLGADIHALLEHLEDEPDLTIQRALLLSLGQFKEQALTLEEKKQVIGKLQSLYTTHPDPGLHAAAEWLLRHWQERDWIKQTQQEWAKDKPRRQQKLEQIRLDVAQKKNAAAPQWYVNGQGQTLIVLPGPSEFLMGSPPTEVDRKPNEKRHRRRINRTFAIAATPVTAEQFLRFRPRADFLLAADLLDPDSPCEGIRWYEAAKYCNWLSEQEGVPKDQWCYQPTAGGDYASGMELVPDYLTRTGYRLPTEAEWEYAVRAGAVTSRYYGSAEDMLVQYAWYRRNSDDRTQPVGRLKPNEWGLFDGLGNVWNFTLSRGGKLNSAAALPDEPTDAPALTKENSVGSAAEGNVREDREDKKLSLEDADLQIIRGGAWLQRGEQIRCAERGVFSVVGYSHGIGFRVARTFR